MGVVNSMERLKEPSTWAGVSAFLAALAGVLPGYYAIGALVLSAAASSLAVRLPEGVTAREAVEVIRDATTAAVEAERVKRERERAQVPGA